MDTKFYSYFNSQKKLPITKVSSAINIPKSKQFLTTEKAAIFVYFLTIENLLIQSQKETNKENLAQGCFGDQSIYFLFFNWSVLNIKHQEQKPLAKNIDSFVSFFSSFIVFTSLINKSNSFTSVLFYFNKYSHLYTRPISSKTRLNSNVNYITKNERFQYQQLFDTFTQNSAFTDFNSGAILLFNKIFFENKNIKLGQANKLTKRLCSKSFINMLSERSAETKTSTTKKINLFKYSLPAIKRAIIKTSIIIPFTATYWTSPKNLKKVKTIKKGQLVTINNKNSRFYSKTYNKAIAHKSFTYQGYPTDFQESIVNSSVFIQIKNVLSLLTNARFSFYQINALSLVRYAFDQEAKNKNIELDASDQAAPTLLFKSKKSFFFLNQLEEKLESRYRYVAVHIKDRVRVTFFTRYLKKANFLATYYAFVLSKLPRKRKETKLISFRITLLKIFSAERKEIIGIRIRFQGRLNRWRRTKHIVGKKGRLYDYSHNNFMDFGIGQAITRKGTQGIRIWICYKAEFAATIQKAIINYRALPRITKISTLLKLI